MLRRRAVRLLSVAALSGLLAACSDDASGGGGGGGGSAGVASSGSAVTDAQLCSKYVDECKCSTDRDSCLATAASIQDTSARQCIGALSCDKMCDEAQVQACIPTSGGAGSSGGQSGGGKDVGERCLLGSECLSGLVCCNSLGPSCATISQCGGGF